MFVIRVGFNNSVSISFCISFWVSINSRKIIAFKENWKIDRKNLNLRTNKNKKSKNSRQRLLNKFQLNK